MVASIQSISKFSGQRKQAYENNLAATAEQHEKLQLIVELQSTLDVQQLLQVFLENISATVRVDGIAFEEDERDLHIKVGKQSNHSCGYRLLSGSDFYGEVTFKRSKRFKEDELRQLEELLVLLLVPIRNALRYLDAVNQALHAPALTACDRTLLTQILSREIERAKRHNRPLSLLTLRFECSKQKRTTKLSAGVSKEIITLLYKNCRDTDLLLRSGGKEFQLLLPMDDNGAQIIGGRIKKDLKRRLGENSEHALRVDMGQASLTGTDSVKSLLGRARNQLTG